MRAKIIPADPRWLQIGVLSGLALYSQAALDFSIGTVDALAVFATAWGTQAWFSARLGLRLDLRSPTISALSLCLLLRAANPWLAALAATLTIASKFLIRRRGKHVFNPTNFGIVAATLLSDGVWTSPGQWGSAAVLVGTLACFGIIVVHRARRFDVTFAFLAAYSALLFTRAWIVGDPWAIPRHQLENGALLIFAFFMISDPKTTPDSRPGRVAFAMVVAGLGGILRFGIHEPDALLWALALGSLTVPLIDALLPAERFRWPERHPPLPVVQPTLLRKEAPMTTPRLFIPVLIAAALCLPTSAAAFCGFYVARADSELWNRSSRVVLVRDGDRTVITMGSDYRGEPDEFALVVPVPTAIEREQIHVLESAAIDHLDAYTAPRLVEYFDPDPCLVGRSRRSPFELRRHEIPAPTADLASGRSKALGVTIEATYQVGEYEILILSARESGGLTTWLVENGYRLPEGAEKILASYLAQGMRFFVAKVDAGEHRRLGYRNLRPISIAFESRKFMLPLRLGTVNADGPQDLLIFALTRRGRVETTNYRTVRLPSGMEVPPAVKDDFSTFYRDLFDYQWKKERRNAVFLEYAWDMAWCDPCAADPLSPEELSELGVFWIEPGPGPARDVFVSRLHVRYEADRFPEDLILRETGDRTNFQGRYVVRHPFEGSMRCSAADAYFDELQRRRQREIETLAFLTGRDPSILATEYGGSVLPEPQPWWKRIWGTR